MWHPQRARAVRLDQAEMLRVLSDVRRGDFGVRLPLDWIGVPGKIADTLNAIIAANENLAAELARVSRVVGKRAGSLSASGFRPPTRRGSRASSPSIH
jgi:hypothetical protein